MKKLLLAIPVLIDKNKVLTECLNSLNNQSLVKSGETDILIILNNKNDDDIIDQLENFDNVYLVINEENVGVAGSWNQALIEAKNEYQYIINMGYDVIMSNNKFLEEFVKYTENNNLDFCITEQHWFNCWIADPRNFINKIGFFDENFYPGYWEDIDILIRMDIAEKIRNFKRSKFNASGSMIHLGSKTINDHDTYIPHHVWNYSYTVNQLYLKKKWNVMDNEFFLNNSGVPQNCFNNPFNNIKFDLTFWILDKNHISASKKKWDSCLDEYISDNARKNR